MLHEPAGSPRGAVAVCHPHPQYGGDMDNAVVVAVSEALVAAGLAALRFNFGGVGGSEGAYGHGRDEQGDVRAAVAALAARMPEDVPLAVAGYSFGAWVGTIAAETLPRVARVVAIAPPLALVAWEDAGTKPLALVVGGDDHLCPPEAVRRLAAARGAAATTLPGADHFLSGREREVAAAVVAHLAPR